MKIGMNLLLWTARPDFKKNESLVRQIKNWDFDGIELPVSAVNKNDCEKFRKLCKDLQLGITTVMALNGTECDPISGDTNKRDKAVDEIKKAVDKTVALGGDILSGPLYQGIGSFSGQEPSKDEWSRAVEVIRKVGEYANKVEVKLALEPLNRYESYLFNTLSGGYKFVKDVGMDNIGLLADTYHSNIEEKNINKAWEEVVSKIYHVHISENDRGTPGTGHAIPKEIFKMLTVEGYEGWIVIEAFSNKLPDLIPSMHIWRSFTPTEDEVAIDGLKFIREMLVKSNTVK